MGLPAVFTIKDIAGIRSRDLRKLYKKYVIIYDPIRWGMRIKMFTMETESAIMSLPEPNLTKAIDGNLSKAGFWFLVAYPKIRGGEDGHEKNTCGNSSAHSLR